MRFSRVRTRVTFALAALGAICLTVSSVQAFDQPPQKIPAELQSKPVQLTLELEASPASPEPNSSKLVLPSDATRRAMGGDRLVNGNGADCGDGVCDGDENCGNCAADCGECPCANVYPGDCDDAQIGIQGDFIQECGDGGWISLAFPIETGGGMIDTVTFQLSTNHAGGDLYLMGDIGCQPDTSSILAGLCCALSGVETGAAHELHFDPVMTSADVPTWVVLVERTGRAGTNGLGFFDGGNFKAFGLGRSMLEPSLPNRAFANLVGTGNPGDWTDLHDLGGGLGSPFCVGLSFTGQDPGGPYDCVANPDPTGACCNVDGDECQMMRGFECGIAGGVYLGDGTTCDDCLPACNPDAGDCCAANGTPGCDDPMCCHYVCLQDPFCCGAYGGDWDVVCAQAANDPEVGCGQIGQVCEPTSCVDHTVDPSATSIQTGPDLEQDGVLRVVPDEYGAWGDVGFCDPGPAGGCEEDLFKPVGFDASEVMYSNALFLYIDRGDPALNQRAVLTGYPILADVYPIDIGPSALFREIPLEGAAVASDTNGDGLDDSLTSSFAVCNGPADVSLTFDVTHSVEQVASGPGVGVSVLTQTHTITNESSTAIDFVLIRQVDSDLFWIGDHTDDAVGTMTHAEGGDLSVYTMEHLQPTTAVTLSSPQAAFYYGAKGDFDPDGLGTCDDGTCNGGPHAGEACDPLDSICDGGPPYGCGTDFQQWDAYGLPEGWANHIAGVGYNTDGESGPAPAPCDPAAGGCSCEGSIGIVILVSLEPGESTCVCIQHTYGQRTPWMGGTCPPGCDNNLCGSCPTDVDDDGHTGPFDLAMLLGSWGPVTPDTVCLDADQNGGIEAFDLAVLLANWGPCE